MNDSMATNIKSCLTTGIMWQTAIENCKLELDRLAASWDGSKWVTDNNWDLSFKLGPITWNGTPSTVGAVTGKSLILIIRYNPTSSAVTTELVSNSSSDTGNYINGLLSPYYTSSTERRFLVGTAQSSPARTNLKRSTIDVTSIGSVSNGTILDLKFKWRGGDYYFSQVSYTSTHNLVYMKFDDKSETVIVQSKSMPTSTTADINAYFTECGRLFEDGWYVLNSHSGQYRYTMGVNKTLIFHNYKGNSILNVETENITNGSTNYNDNTLGVVYMSDQSAIVNQRQFGTQTTLNSSGGVVWFNRINTTSDQSTVLVSDGQRNMGSYNSHFTDGYLYSTLNFTIPENSGNSYIVNQKSKSATGCNRFKFYTTSLGTFGVTINQKSDYPIFKILY